MEKWLKYLVSEMIHDVKMEMTPADPKHHHNKHIIMGKGFEVFDFKQKWILSTLRLKY